VGWAVAVLRGIRTKQGAPHVLVQGQDRLPISADRGRIAGGRDYMRRPPRRDRRGLHPTGRELSTVLNPPGGGRGGPPGGRTLRELPHGDHALHGVRLPREESDTSRPPPLCHGRPGVATDVGAIGREASGLGDRRGRRPRTTSGPRAGSSRRPASRPIPGGDRAIGRMRADMCGEAGRDDPGCL